MNEQWGHQNRDDLAGEHRFGDAGQLVLLVAFVFTWILDSFVIHYSTFAVRYVSPFIRVPLGLVILGLSIFLVTEGMRIVFGEKREIPAVITKGVFGRMRHPLYLGSILLYVGLWSFTLSLFSALLIVVIIAFYHFIAGHEEKLLVAKFGEEYKQYMRTVPMWIPRLSLIVRDKER
ncbi:MAG: isoprenylcysteine carboxylmethyltransferase family protein [candidate division WOR-3 bacterium]|nr:MAG: isoprenylcysteine carboxylmethyltransferase family protein [candidate division WOR-3 bacterium]